MSGLLLYNCNQQEHDRYEYKESTLLSDLFVDNNSICPWSLRISLETTRLLFDCWLYLFLNAFTCESPPCRRSPRSEWTAGMTSKPEKALSKTKQKSQGEDKLTRHKSGRVKAGVAPPHTAPSPIIGTHTTHANRYLIKTTACPSIRRQKQQ